MPRFVIKDPDSGITIAMTGESAPSEQEIEQAIQAKVAEKSQRTITEIDPNVMVNSPVNQRKQFFERMAAETSAPEAFAVGAGRGLTSIARGIGIAEQEDPSVTAAIDALSTRSPVAFGAGEIAGETAPFLPAGVAVGGIRALGARALATGAVGATEGGLIARGRGGDEQSQVETAGLAGVAAGGLELALPVIGRIGGALIRRVSGKAPVGGVFDAAGRPTQELKDALSKSGLTMDDLNEQAQSILAKSPDNVDLGQAGRGAFIESQGITPTKAQVTRNAADFQAQQEAAKTSGRVRDALEQQDAILTSRFNQSVIDTGGLADAPTSTVTDALVGKATVLDQQVSDLYKAARASAPGEKNIKFDALTKELRNLAPANRRSGGAIEAIVGDLQSKGVLDADMAVVGRIDVETAEDVRKLMNELYDPQNGFANGILRQLKDKLDDDVFIASGVDTFKQGRKAKADFEKELSRAGVSKFDSRKANLVRDVLENKINPDTFTSDVVFSKKWRAQDIKQLKDYISTDEAGKAAFDDMRADTMSTIRDKAFIGPEDELGNRALSRAALENQIDKIGKAKMAVLFTGEERKFLDNMLKLAKLREPVRGTALGRGPSAQAVSRLESKLKDLPAIGALINSISVDARGRIALKANPTLTARLPSNIEVKARGTAAPIGAAGALTVGGQE